MVKNLPVSAGDIGEVGSVPGSEGPLEEGMATHSTPVIWPGESYGQRSLAGYSLWGHKESDTTEPTQHTCIITQNLTVNSNELIIS